MTGLEDLKNVWINREGFARSYSKLCDLNERLDSLPSSEPFAKCHANMWQVIHFRKGLRVNATWYIMFSLAARRVNVCFRAAVVVSLTLNENCVVLVNLQFLSQRLNYLCF